MNKKVIFSSIALAFIFSGCLATKPKPIVNDTVKNKVDKVDKSIKKTKKVIKNKIETQKDDIAKPEESELKDAVIENIENEVDIMDDTTTNIINQAPQPQLIESVD